MFDNLTDAINTALGAAAAGTIAAICIGVRQAVKNFGKTESEIRQAKFDKALKDLERAHATPDPADDLPAEKAAALAEKKLDNAQRLKAITDGLSSKEHESE